MATSLVDTESVLAIDLGSISTRAFLFDMVEGQYRFLASGVSPSTIKAPFYDMGEGMHRALQNLQEKSGRQLLNQESQLILPAASDGSGVDRLVITHSAGPELRVVLAGLLSDVSLESARHLVSSICSRVVETVGLTDRRSTQVQLDAVLHAEPNLIVLAGGTDQGASRSVFKLAELVLLICRILPPEKRPVVLYAGNQALAARMKESLGKHTKVFAVPNIRPAIEQENLNPAQDTLADIVTRIREMQIGGLKEISKVCSVPPLPSSQGLGRMVRFLSHIYDPQKGVLGVDLGAFSTTLAAGVRGEMDLKVLSYGMGNAVEFFMSAEGLKQIMRWLPVEMPVSTVNDYLWQKKIFPASIPMTDETMAIEQAIARCLLMQGMGQMGDRFKRTSWEPILAAGSVITQAAKPEHSMLMLLDGLQPVGITTVLLDQNGIIPALGAIAKVNNVLPVQVLESGVILNLGTVIAPLIHARPGTPVLRVRLEYSSGNVQRLEINAGTLTRLSLQSGQEARVRLETIRRTEIDPYNNRRLGDFRIVGGACGAVIDTRGRPLVLPEDAAKRRDILAKWALSME